jgi:hypothetical protein
MSQKNKKKPCVSHETHMRWFPLQLLAKPYVRAMQNRVII